MVSAFESFDVVQSGTCQMGFGSPYYGQENHPLFLCYLEFHLECFQEMTSWFYNGDGIKLANEIYREFNLKFFLPAIQEIKWGMV